MNHSSAIDAFISFQCGQESGFTYFFKTLYKPVLHYACSLIDNELAVEDIVEESFIKLWEKRTTVQSAASVKPYLYAIVRNACIDFLRKTKSEAEARKEIQGLSDITTSPLQDATTFPDIHLNIEAALLHLPQRKRQIFSMFHLQHKTISQIAAELSLSTGSVKNQKSRALELLRLYFSGRQIDKT